MIVEYYDGVEGLLLKGHRGKYVAKNLSGYARLYHLVYGTTEVDLIKKYTARIRQLRDEEFACNFVDDMEPLVLDPRFCWVGLTALQEIIHIDIPVVQDRMVNVLAKLRLHNPEVLDVFLSEVVTLSDLSGFRRRIESTEIRESAGEALMTYTLAMELEALQMPALWKELQWALNVALECRSLGQWAKIIARRLVNIAYGVPIFTVEHT
jgi:hypothetical protein